MSVEWTDLGLDCSQDHRFGTSSKLSLSVNGNNNIKVENDGEVDPEYTCMYLLFSCIRNPSLVDSLRRFC
jgi:hypothetical protein